MSVRHDFSCEAGHILEKIVNVNEEGWDKQPCGFEGCANPAEKVFLSKRRSFLDRRIVVYKDATGNVQFPGSADEPLPARLKKLGYERVEMDFHSARQFQKEYNKSEKAKASDKLEFMHYLESEQRREDREDLLHDMRNMSERGRAYAEYVIAQNNTKDASKYYSHDPGFYIDAIDS